MPPKWDGWIGEERHLALQYASTVSSKQQEQRINDVRTEPADDAVVCLMMGCRSSNSEDRVSERQQNDPLCVLYRIVTLTLTLALGPAMAAVVTDGLSRCAAAGHPSSSSLSPFSESSVLVLSPHRLPRSSSPHFPESALPLWHHINH